MKISNRIVLIFLLILVLIGGTGCMNSEGKIVNYLEEKYSEKFVVEQKKEDSILFPKMYGKDKIFAYPEGKPESIFVAGESESNEHKYYDTYILARWGQELTESMRETMKDNFPEEPIYKVDLYIASGDYDVSMKDMSIFDYLKGNKEVTVVLNMAIKTSGKPTLEEFSLGMYNAFEKIKQLGTDSYTLSVGFVDPSENVSDYIRTSNVNNIPWSNLDGKIYGEIGVDETFSIDSPADLINYYTSFKE